MNVRLLPLDLDPGSARGLRLVFAAWTLAAVVLLLQGAVEQAIDRGAVSLEFLLRWRLYPVVLWAAVTPLVLAAAHRWPPRSGRWPVHVAVHGLLFSAWLLASNALLRLPDVLTEGPDGVGAEAVAAAVEYAPACALLWIALVLLAVRGEAAAPAVEAPADEDEVRDEPLALRVGYRTYLVARETVRRVEADGDYLQVHTGERTHRIRGPLKDFHRELDDDRFLRIHRSTVVNVRFVREVQPYFHGDYVAILKDGTELRVPRSRRGAIRRLLGADRA